MLVYAFLLIAGFALTTFFEDTAPIISAVKDVFILAAGIFGLFISLLLSMDKVPSGKIWGNSPAGCVCIGLGLISFGLLKLLQTQVSFGIYLMLMILSLFVLVGLAIEYRTRKQGVLC